MDYEKAYKETFEEYYLLNQQIIDFKREDERFDVIFDFRTFIGEYETKLAEMEIKKGKDRNEKEIDRLKVFISRLMSFYNTYGMFYYRQKIYARKLQLRDKEFLDLQMAVAELKKENEILKQMNDF